MHHFLMLLTVGPAFVQLPTVLLVGRRRREAQLAQLAQRKQEAAAEVGLDDQATHRVGRTPMPVKRGLGGSGGAGLDHQAMHRRYSCRCSFYVSLSWDFGCCFAVGYRATNAHTMSACLDLCY